MSKSLLSGKVALAGVGTAGLTRSSGQSSSALTVQACLRALDDAGLTVHDVDGLVQQVPTAEEGRENYPRNPFASPSITEMQDTLGIGPLNWYGNLDGVPAGLTSVIMAAQAIAMGACDVAVAYRTVLRRTTGRGGVSDAPSAEAHRDMQFRLPYGAASAAQWAAMWCQRHMHVYGTTHDQMGMQCVTQRRHAALNPQAVLREPLTLADYHASRWVTYPFHLYDCDLPIDSSIAIVLTSADRAKDLRSKPVWVEAAAMATGLRTDWEEWEDMTFMAGRYAADRLWSTTEFTPADMDFAQLYDGFSWFAMSWMECLGFCKLGESGPFVADGHTALGGSLPVNTDGGQLSAGRTHGIGKVAESILQLRGEAGSRQVPGARVGIMAAGAPIRGAVMIARSDD
jgi:acetyl-CoA acetyltransferase